MQWQIEYFFLKYDFPKKKNKSRNIEKILHTTELQLLDTFDTLTAVFLCIAAHDGHCL